MMRQQNTNNSNNSNRRPRGRSNNNSSNRKPQQSRNGVFDSNGPGGRIRGNASQLKEKYLQLARDATVSGDRVLAESLHQFAEHYFRVVNDSTDPQTQSQSQAQSQAQTQPQAQTQSHSRSSSSEQRNNQSDNYRHRNSRSHSDHENKAPENVRGDKEIETPAALSPNVDNVADSSNVDSETRKPAPRSRVRSRRPRYEESSGVKAESSVNIEPAAEIQPVSDVPAAPVATKVEAKPVVAELPLGVDDTPVAEKPKRKPRTPKAATSEAKTPRPRGRPRKVVAKVEDDSSTETA